MIIIVIVKNSIEANRKFLYNALIVNFIHSLCNFIEVISYFILLIYLLKRLFNSRNKQKIYSLNKIANFVINKIIIFIF